MIDISLLIKFVPVLSNLLSAKVFVSVQVQRDKETKYILRIKNNSNKQITITKLIANPPTLSKNNSWTCLNDSKFFQNKELIPGEPIEFPFYPKDLVDLRKTLTFQVEYICKHALGLFKVTQKSNEFKFTPSDFFVKIGTQLVQKY